MEDRLTERQQAFIAHFLESFNGTRAAKLAGYSHPSVEASKLLRLPKVKAIINEELEQIKNDGIANKAVRIAELSTLNDDLKRVQESRAEAAKVRYDNGEDLPEEVETGLLIEQTKQVGAGPNAITTKEWVLDKTLIDSRTKILEQVAKEVGDRDKRIELTGANGGPLEVASAKSKLFDLIDDDEPDSE